MTRDCIDPWSALYVSSSGAVKPCCVMRENVGRIGVDGSLGDIFNGSAMREYRQGILDERFREHARIATPGAGSRRKQWPQR